MDRRAVNTPTAFLLRASFIVGFPIGYSPGNADPCLIVSRRRSQVTCDLSTTTLTIRVASRIEACSCAACNDDGFHCFTHVIVIVPLLRSLLGDSFGTTRKISRSLCIPGWNRVLRYCFASVSVVAMTLSAVPLCDNGVMFCGN
jgi:hypothetical protein